MLLICMNVYLHYRLNKFVSFMAFIDEKIHREKVRERKGNMQ